MDEWQTDAKMWVEVDRKSLMRAIPPSSAVRIARCDSTIKGLTERCRPILRLSAVETVPNGFRIRYQKCDIYYSDAFGVHEVYGDIQTKYNTLGGPAGPLGLPATDVQTIFKK